MVEEETRRYRPTKNYLSYLPTPDFSAFEVGSIRLLMWLYLGDCTPGKLTIQFFFVFLIQTEIMKNEFERLAARQPMELLSMKR